MRILKRALEARTEPRSREQILRFLYVILIVSCRNMIHTTVVCLQPFPELKKWC